MAWREGRCIHGAVVAVSHDAASSEPAGAFRDATEVERAAMRRAVALARLGWPSPNPPVGAVVLRGDTVVGEGYHRFAGAPHAEVEALRAAGDAARGATVFVTLEPCNHHGRTPPCTGALRAAGVARVVYACADPNPHVAGFGREALRSAGIAVDAGFSREAQAEAEALLAPWRTFITLGRAHVTLKVGMSLDGRIATRTGASQWITSPAARADAHRLRAEADAVLAGSGTVRADDPALTVRDAPLRDGRAPVRVALDSTLALPPEASLVRTARDTPTWVLCREGADPARRARLRDEGVTVLEVPVGSDGVHVDLEACMQALAGRGVVGVLCEGGGALHGALRDASLADRVVCYVAPVILGGTRALSAFGGLGAAVLSDATRLGPWRVDTVGPDLRIVAEVVRNVYGHR